MNERNPKQQSTLSRLANQEVKIRGIDLRLQGCLLGCGFWWIYSFLFGSSLIVVPLFAPARSIILVLGVGLVIPLVFHVSATWYLQSLWWGRYRDLHPAFHHSRGNPITAIAPLSVIAFIGGYLIYFYFKQ